VGKQADPENRFLTFDASTNFGVQTAVGVDAGNRKHGHNLYSLEKSRDNQSQNISIAEGKQHTKHISSYSSSMEMVNKFGVPSSELWYDETYGFIPRTIKRRWDVAGSSNRSCSVSDAEQVDIRCEKVINFPIRNSARV
jgi:hypothetical protein